MLYPNGWSHIQVKEACGGTSAPFNLGNSFFILNALPVSNWQLYIDTMNCVDWVDMFKQVYWFKRFSLVHFCLFYWVRCSFLVDTDTNERPAWVDGLWYELILKEKERRKQRQRLGEKEDGRWERSREKWGRVEVTISIRTAWKNSLREIKLDMKRERDEKGEGGRGWMKE